MKVAITGGTGFVGRHLVSLLKAENIDFTVFDRSKYNLDRKETLKDFLSGKDFVVHLAAVNKDEDFTNIIRVNILGTKGLLDGMLAFAPSARLIFASSFQVYLKDSIYGASKKIAEELITDYSSRSGQKSIILRITNMYGSGGRPFYNSALATFLYQIRHDDTVSINGDGSQRRDYLHVVDGAGAILKSLSYIPKKSVTHFDICTGKLISLSDITKLLQKLTNKKISISFNRKVSVDDWDFGKDYTKAKKLLGWEPRISIEEGLAMAIKEENI